MTVVLVRRQRRPIRVVTKPYVMSVFELLAFTICHSCVENEPVPVLVLSLS